MLPRKEIDLRYNYQILLSQCFKVVNKVCMEESLAMPKHFFFTCINTVDEAFLVQANTQTHPPSCLHFSSNFSKVFNCMVWICCTSFTLIFIFLFNLYKETKQNKKNLLPLSLDNGRLCISCICIHKIKWKQKYFLYETILFSNVCYGCCSQFMKTLFTDPFRKQSKTRKPQRFEYKHSPYSHVQKGFCHG